MLAQRVSQLLSQAWQPDDELLTIWDDTLICRLFKYTLRASAWLGQSAVSSPQHSCPKSNCHDESNVAVQMTQLDSDAQRKSQTTVEDVQPSSHGAVTEPGPSTSQPSTAGQNGHISTAGPVRLAGMWGRVLAMGLMSTTRGLQSILLPQRTSCSMLRKLTAHCCQSTLLRSFWTAWLACVKSSHTCRTAACTSAVAFCT